MTSTNPYFGPNPIPAGERIYGREDEIADLVDILASQRIVLLYSPSGAGKTSLIQAALIDELRKEHYEVLFIRGFTGAAAANSTTHNKYIASVIEALDAATPVEARVSRRVGMSLEEYLEARGKRPKTARVAVLADGEEEPEPASREIVLVFDQFEEILTLDPIDREAKVKFFEEIGRVLKDRGRLALFSMREDYIAGMDDYVHYLPTNLKTRYRLGLLDRTQARAAIVKPAERVGVAYDEKTGAAQLLVEDLCRLNLQTEEGVQTVAGEFIEPVQLQVACHNLWEECRPEKLIVAEDVRNASVDGALESYYAHAVRNAAELAAIPERDIRDWVEEKLITPRGIRAQVLAEPTHAGGLPNRAISPLLDKAHLIRREPRGPRQWYELAHDRLIDPIRRNNKEWFKRNLHLLQSKTRDWLAGGRRSQALLSGVELLRSSTWRLRRRPRLRDEEREFFKLSARRALGRFALVVVPFGAMVLVTGWQTAERARESEANERLALLRDDGDVKLQYARVELAASRAPFQALRDAIEAAQDYKTLREKYRGPERKVERDALDMSAHTAFVEALRRGQGARIVLNAEPRAARAVVFSPVSATPIVAYGGSLGSVFVADISTGHQFKVAQCNKAGSSIYALAFSTDGSMLAGGCEDGEVIVWDVRLGAPQWPVRDSWKAHWGATRALAFVSENRKIVSGGYDSRLKIKEIGRDSQPAEFRWTGGRRPTGQIWTLAYHARADALVAGDGVANIAACSPATEECTLAYRAPETRDTDSDAALAIAFTPDGNSVITGNWSGKVIRWSRDFSSQVIVRDPQKAWGGPTTGPAYAIAIGDTIDLDPILYYSTDARIQAEGIGRPLSEFDRSGRMRVIGDDVIAMSYHSPTRLLAAATAAGPVVVMETVGNYDLLKSDIVVPDLAGASPTVSATASDRELLHGAVVSANEGTTRVVLAKQNTISLVDLRTTEPRSPQVVDQKDAGANISRVVHAASVRRMAMVAGETTVQLWDTSGPLAHLRNESCPRVRRIALSPSGTSLICASGSHLELIDLADGTRQSQETYIEIREMKLNAAGTLLAVGGVAANGQPGESHTVQLWELSGSRLTQRSTRQMTMTTLAQRVFELGFVTSLAGAGSRGPDEYVVAAGKNGYLDVWNARDGSFIWELRAESSRSIHHLAFDADRSRLASADDRGRIYLWDTRKTDGTHEWKQVRLTSTGLPQERIGMLAFAGGGDMLLAGGLTFNAWDMDVTSLRRKACSIFSADRPSSAEFVPRELQNACK